ncbi:hypothetical protein E1180_03160 [Roseibium denhamense]|nr:hypothetical protein [Roseibium denhamense]
MMRDWPKPYFSNWAFAEREDLLEEKTYAGVQKFGQSMIVNAEKAFSDHMDFVSHRLQQDFECWKSLTQCTAPEETLAKLQSFYSEMANEYQEHFEKQAALLREGFSDNAAAVEALQETALQTVGELSKAAEESLEEAAQLSKPKPTPKQALSRRRTKATPKPK